MVTNNFINIHTHKTPLLGNIAILNVFAGEKLPLHLPKNIYFSIGLHPWYLENIEYKIDSLYESATNERVIAIGECGLDKNAGTPLAFQETVFLKQIELSEKLQKPLIIHCVKAFDELLRIRKNEQPVVPWIIHGFNKSAELGLQCIEHGMFLSFGKTLFNEMSKSISLFQLTSFNNFFLETEESNYEIDMIYKRCAEIKCTTVDQLREQIYFNFATCFFSNTAVDKRPHD